MALGIKDPGADEPARRLVDELDDIARRCARMPVEDGRTPEEILGWDERGLPRR